MLASGLHMNTHAFVCSCTRMHLYTHVHVSTCTLMHMYVLAQSCTYTLMHTHAHIHLYTCIQGYALTDSQTEKASIAWSDFWVKHKMLNS